MKTYRMFLCVLFVIGTVSAVNYCATECGAKHIGCNNNNQFAPSCGSNAKLVTMTPALKKLLVHGHNEKRNLIAGGGHSKHSPACRMATMDWDDELAFLAALSVKRCQLGHDQCRVTQKFPFSGQNLAYYFTTPPPPQEYNDEIKLTKAINDWYDEVEDSEQSYIDSYVPHSGKNIGHFAVMVADRNIRLGCAASSYINSNRLNYLIICNYATTKAVGSTIYAKCNQAASSCATGTNPQYPHLCSSAEQYDVTNL